MIVTFLSMDIFFNLDLDGQPFVIFTFSLMSLVGLSRILC